MFNSFFERYTPGAPRDSRRSVGLPRRWTMRLVMAGCLVGIGGCSVSGPPFLDAPAGDRALPDLLDRGYYRFTPAVPFFDGPRLGEVYFSRARSRENPRGLFHLRILGRDRKGAIRVRQYEGEVHRFRERIELRAERCYLFGKREWDDRITPLNRWECDHLVFAYESPSNFSRVERLHPVVDSVRGEYTEWFRANALQPMPGADAQLPGNAKSKPIFFAGQIFPIPAGELLPDDATVVVWGFQAGRVLRDGQILKVRGSRPAPARNAGGESATVRQEFTGELKIVSRPGDFLLCRWLRPPASSAREAEQASGEISGVAYTRDSLLNQGGGLFD